MTDIPLLSLAIWVPIIGGLLVLATGSDRNAPLARMLALAVAVAGFVVTIPLYTGFDVGDQRDAVRGTAVLDSALQHQLPPRGRWHLGAVRAAQQPSSP
jgi:NADH:ubiquinone oxidoreductase subunit 4 (subunit M)